MKKRYLGIILVFALFLGFALGLFFAQPFTSAKEEGVYLPIYDANEKPIFKYNDNGQSYGTMEGIGPENPEMPDLIAVQGIGGKSGYCYVSDMDGDVPLPKTPEEAVAYNKIIEEMAEKAREAGEEYLWTIPVYEADGVTVIDSFGISIPDYKS